MGDSDAYEYVVPNKLKLKRKPIIAKTTKKKRQQRRGEGGEGGGEEFAKLANEAAAKDNKDEKKEEEELTPMQKAFEEAQRQREAKLIAKLSSKSHRERIEELNHSLDTMSEHFDIPKVGPG